MMLVQPTDLPEVLIIKPRVFEDSRGFFLETWNRETFAQQGIDVPFVQDNLSRSARGTVRGLHYQVRKPQGKLVRVLRGEIYDVAVDLRRSSRNFGKWVGVRLTESDHRSLYVPAGFAHGFCVMSETADVFYKCTELYSPGDERSVLWNDPDLNISWPLTVPPVLSDKDLKAPRLIDTEGYA